MLSTIGSPELPVLAFICLHRRLFSARFHAPGRELFAKRTVAEIGSPELLRQEDIGHEMRSGGRLQASERRGANMLYRKKDPEQRVGAIVMTPNNRVENRADNRIGRKRISEGTTTAIARIDLAPSQKNCRNQARFGGVIVSLEGLHI